MRALIFVPDHKVAPNFVEKQKEKEEDVTSDNNNRKSK